MVYTNILTSSTLFNILIVIIIHNVMNILQYYDVMLEINAALVSLKTFTLYFVLY